MPCSYIEELDETEKTAGDIAAQSSLSIFTLPPFPFRALGSSSFTNECGSELAMYLFNLPFNGSRRDSTRLKSGWVFRRLKEHRSRCRGEWRRRGTKRECNFLKKVSHLVRKTICGESRFLLLVLFFVRHGSRRKREG